MPTALLNSKLYMPPIRPDRVQRPRLIAHLNAGQGRKLTLVSAPAGFGKTTLIAEWIAGLGLPAAWISLDKADNDLGRFLTLDALKANRQALLDFYATHTLAMVAGFMAVYIIQTALSLPGAAILSLAAGAIFGAKPKWPLGPWYSKPHSARNTPWLAIARL